jgi:choice-of-anchor B domain-containing protein
VVLGFLPQTGTSNVIWADMKVYNDHVFIIRESRNHGLQVFDMTKLRQYYGTPSSFVRQLTHDAFYDEVTSSHNVVINEETGFAYLVGTKTCSGGLHVVDVSTPQAPRFAGCFSEDGYTHDAQCVIYNGPDTRYRGKEVCFNYNEDTLTIVDVSNKQDMRMVGRVTYDNAYYTHQGWLTEDMTHLMLNDELDEQRTSNKNTRTLLWDVTDLSDPKLVGSHYADVTSIDHNLYIRGDVGYLSNYCSGLRILSATEVASGRAPEVAFFDVADYCDDVQFKGAWSNYPYFKSESLVVSSIELGLFVLKANL